MKVSSILKPTMLFAAGTVATGAHAATTITDPYYAGGAFGTPTVIEIGGSAQYTFGTTLNGVPGEIKTYDTVLAAFDGSGAQVTSVSSASPFFPAANDPTLASSVVTGSSVKDSAASDAIGIAAVGDKYYGLRFNINGEAQTGYARLNAEGNVINEITYQAIAAVPEPATWAMMIAGFGSAGAALRRRRRRQPLAVAA